MVMKIVLALYLKVLGGGFSMVLTNFGRGVLEVIQNLGKDTLG
jgi:hypothetical protein